MPYIIHDFVTEPTYLKSKTMVTNKETIQEKTMLTEVDIERIMSAEKQLAESIADATEFDLIDDIEVIEMLDEDIPVSETNGLM